MNNIEETLSSLKRKIEAINTKRIENKTRLEALEQEKQNLLIECSKLGVDASQLGAIVVQEEAKLNQEIARFEVEVGNTYNELSKF